MGGGLQIRLACALGAGAVVSGCAGPVHVAQLAPGQALQPGGYAFAALAPNSSAIEVSARKIVAQKLEARGFSAIATPRYSVDLAVSERPGPVDVYAGDAPVPPGHTDVEASHPFPGQCHDSKVRLVLVFTERETGRVTNAVRSGQLRCAQGMAKALNPLADAALAEALR
jgi:hypothetical protein